MNLFGHLLPKHAVQFGANDEVRSAGSITRAINAQPIKTDPIRAEFFEVRQIITVSPHTSCLRIPEFRRQALLDQFVNCVAYEFAFGFASSKCDLSQRSFLVLG